MQCGGYGQVGRPTDAGREGGRRTVVHALAASLSDATRQFPVPDGAEPGTGGRFGARSLFASVPRTGRLRAEREVHHLALPDRDKSGAKFGAGQPLPADGNLIGCAGDRGCRGRRREDARCRGEAPEHRAAPDRGDATKNDPARDRETAGETASGGAPAQVSGTKLWRDFEDFGMFGERAEITAVSGVRNAASGISPPRGAAIKTVEVGPGRGGSHEL